MQQVVSKSEFKQKALAYLYNVQSDSQLFPRLDALVIQYD